MAEIAAWAHKSGMGLGLSYGSPTQSRSFLHIHDSLIRVGLWVSLCLSVWAGWMDTRQTSLYYDLRAYQVEGENYLPWGWKLKKCSLKLVNGEGVLGKSFCRTPLFSGAMGLDMWSLIPDSQMREQESFIFRHYLSSSALHWEWNCVLTSCYWKWGHRFRSSL